MIRLANDMIRAALARLGHPAPEPGRLHLLGIRGATPTSATEITRIENLADRYNDTITPFGSEIVAMVATVDPGATFTRSPLHPQGCAHLLNGAWTYKRGLHRGRRALVQAAPVRIWRDRDKDFARDPHEMVESGFFGINIHAGGAGPAVGSWSAGCQVIAGGWDGAPWQTLMRLVRAADQATYRYYLIDADDLVGRE